MNFHTCPNQVYLVKFLPCSPPLFLPPLISPLLPLCFFSHLFSHLLFSQVIIGNIDHVLIMQFYVLKAFYELPHSSPTNTLEASATITVSLKGKWGFWRLVWLFYNGQCVSNGLAPEGIWVCMVLKLFICCRQAPFFKSRKGENSPRQEGGGPIRIHAILTVS